jgi:DNA-binding protein H-NS
VTFPPFLAWWDIKNRLFTQAAFMLASEDTIMALTTMSISKLRDLRKQVEAMISTKVAERRQELETHLSALSHHDGVRRGGQGAKLRGKVAPKYRNPGNPSETWSGRGLSPRWMAALIKTGKKKEDFLIAGRSKASAAKAARKTRKVRN